jgi:protein-disulfide isomerase
VRSGVNATPTFFINGERLGGDWRDIEQLAAASEETAASSPLIVGR